MCLSLFEYRQETTSAAAAAASALPPQVDASFRLSSWRRRTRRHCRICHIPQPMRFRMSRMRRSSYARHCSIRHIPRRIRLILRRMRRRRMWRICRARLMRRLDCCEHCTSDEQVTLSLRILRRTRLPVVRAYARTTPATCPTCLQHKLSHTPRLRCRIRYLLRNASARWSHRRPRTHTHTHTR